MTINVFSYIHGLNLQIIFGIVNMWIIKKIAANGLTPLPPFPFFYYICDMEKSFVIYLDIDGVLVSYLKLLDRDVDGKHSFVPKAVEVLNSIITMFDADICIVSTWGRAYWNGSKDGQEFKDFLINRGIIVNGLSFGDPDDRAGYVIKRKLEGYTKFLIIDDETLEYYQKESEIGFNRILPSNSWRCLDEYDLIGVTRNFERLTGGYPDKY